MRRRQFLAAATAAAALPTAGCTALTGPRSLRAKDPVHEDREVYVRFTDDSGAEVMNFDIRYAPTFTDEDFRLPIDLHVWHREDTHLDSFRYTIRAPTNLNGPLVELYLKEPGGGPWPKLTYDDGDGPNETVLAADELGFMGSGSISLELLAEIFSSPETIEFAVTGEFQVSETGALGGTYEAQETLTFTVDHNAE